MDDDLRPRDVNAALIRILKSRVFETSPRAADFIKYIVDETLAGRGESINGTTIAQDVFRKNEEFDSSKNSVVRVHARRVRYMLGDYYKDEGRLDPVRVTIPKGGYKPAFARRGLLQQTTEMDAPKVGPANRMWLAMGTVCTLFLAVFLIGSTFIADTHETPPADLKSISASYPMIAVLPLKNETGDAANDFLEKALQNRLIQELSLFEIIRPVRYALSYETLIMEKPQIHDFAISAVILSVEPDIDLYVKFTDVKNSEEIFSRRVKRSVSTTDYFATLKDIISEVSGNFAGLEGVAVQNRLQKVQYKIDTETLKFSEFDVFECYSTVSVLIENPSPQVYETVYSCLDKFVQKYPENSTLLSAFGWVTYIGAASRESVLEARSVNPNISEQDGIDMMKRAVVLDSTDAFAHQTLSSYYMNTGDIVSALNNAEMSLMENPGDPDNLAWLSHCLIQSGKWERGIKVAQDALDRNAEPSSHYYYAFFMKALNDRDPEAMTKWAEILDENNDYYQDVFSYLAAVASDDQLAIARLQPAIDNFAKRNGNDIMKVVAALMPSQALKSEAAVLFAKAGMKTN